MDTDVVELVDETAASKTDRERRKKVVAVARRFLTHLGSLVRQLGVHDPRNAAVQSVIKDLSRDTWELFRDSPLLSVVFAEGHTFVNGVWVRSTGRAWESAVYLTETLELCHARGFRIDEGTDASKILEFVQFVRQTARQEEPSADRVSDIGIEGIRLILRAEEQDDTSENRAQFREAAAEVFKEGLLALEPSAALKLDVFLRRRQRSLVLKLVQMAEDTPEDLLILTTVRDATLPAVSHALMVAMLAISLARLMDFRRRDLVRLGVCALSHNIGEALLPPELLDLPREPTEAEQAVARQHPLLGMRHLLEHFGFEIPIVERALASVEHHIHYDGHGYPELGHAPAHIFSRIIAVADVYNGLVRDVPLRVGYPPDQAMKLVNRRATTQLDPFMVRQFLRLIGRYPPGTLVELDSGEYALVVGPGGGLEPLTRPRVLVLTDSDGYEVEDLMTVDLGDRHARRRAWKRTIVRTRDSRNLAAPVARYLFADRVEVEPEKLDIDDESLRKRSDVDRREAVARRFVATGQSFAPGELPRDVRDIPGTDEEG